MKCHEAISWHLIRAEKHDISLGNLVAAPKAWNIIRSLCSKKAWTLSWGNLGTAKKAQHQTRQLGSWKARPRTRKCQQGPPKNMQIPWGHLRRNTPTSWTCNRIWDKGQKAIIQETSQRPFKHDISSRNILRVSRSWVANHKYIRTVYYSTQSSPPTLNPLRPTEPSKSHNSNWLYGTSRHSSTLYVLTYCNTYR